MGIAALEWEGMERPERLMLAAAGEQDPLAFTALWFNVSQVEGFRTNWHHHYFKWSLEQMLEGHAKNVVINTPPGSTKTEFFSVHAPVYCMVKYPRVRILNTSYSKDLVNENSERARALLKSNEFREFYPYSFGKDKVDDWTLEQRGKRKHQLFSRSSGGQITGVRGGYMGAGYTGHVQCDDWDKIDDLFSDSKRKKSNTRLINTLRSRRAHSGTPFLFVQQRGHVEDGTAFLLSGGMGLTVDLHVKIPAMIDQDYIDSLPEGIRERCIRDVCGSKQVNGYWSYWPAKESIDDLLALQKAHPYTFVSQYQQEPEKLDGGVFSADDFLFYGDRDEDGEINGDLETPPYFDYRFITADTAQKTKEWNDWTVFAEWGFYKDRIYRLQYQRARMDARTLRRDFENFVKASHAKNGGQDGNLRAVLVEDKSSGTGLIQEMKGRLPIRVTAVPRERDKYMRALDAQPHHADRKVVLPTGDASNYEMISEVASFTPDDSHKFDDQTDVMVDAIEHAFITPVTKKRAAFSSGRSRRRR